MDIRYLIKPRQGGKTYDLINKSANCKYPIIVKDANTCRNIKKKAESMGLTIPEPIPLNTIIKGIKEGRPEPIPEMIGCHVLIDDADYILQTLITKGIRCEIDTIAMVQRNEKGHEVNVYGEDLNEKYLSDLTPIKADSDELKPLTEPQVELLVSNGVSNPDAYGYMGIYTSNNISYETKEGSSEMITKNVSVKKYMRFKNQFSDDIIEIEVDLDKIINDYYS